MASGQTEAVVTGMGAVTPFGTGVERLWRACLEGKSGIGPVSCFDTAGFALLRGGQVPDADVPAGTDRASVFIKTAAAEALAGSGLAGAPGGCAVVLATNFGGACSMERLFEHMKAGAGADAAVAAECRMQSCADRVATELGLSGPRILLSLSCASSTAALCHAADLVRSGRTDVAVAGGYDALSRFAWGGLCALHAMTKDEVRPFDKDRSGTIFSEGAGALVVESAEHARKRGAAILAEVAGGWMNNNAYHMTAPAKQGAGSAAVMKKALEEAGISPDEVDHIDAHGTGTKYNDVTETQALKTVFGDHAASLTITSVKSMTGHMMGAAGSIEAIVSVLSMKHGVIVPTINFRTPDPECDLDYVFNKAREAKKLRTVLSNSAGIGGCNAAVVLRKGNTGS